MMNEELMVGALSLAFTCALLGLRQLFLRGGRPRGVLIRRIEGGGDPPQDNPSDDWPTEIAVTDDPAPRDVFSVRGAEIGRDDFRGTRIPELAVGPPQSFMTF
jgi:hypothetical protein